MSILVPVHGPARGSRARRLFTILPLWLAALPAQSPSLARIDASCAIAAAAATPVPVAVDRPDAGSPRRWLRGTRYKASVDGDAFTFIPFLGADAERNHPVEFRLQSVRVAGRPIDTACREVSAEGTRIAVVRAGLVELYDATAEHVKQSFRFDRLPARGDLEIVLEVATELDAVTDGAELQFDCDRGGVSYRDLVVLDAAGRCVSLQIRWRDGAVHLEVPAAFIEAATLPLVVDPVVAGTALSQVPDAHMLPDLVWNEAAQEFLVVWQERFSASDWDVKAMSCDLYLNPLGPTFWIDQTNESWYRPRVACRSREGMCLVVASVDQFMGPYRIRGRRFQAIGSTRTLHPAFDIESMWMWGGWAGDNYTPDVGADPSPTAPGPFTVVWTHVPILGAGVVARRQVNVDGSLAGPTDRISSEYADSRNPSISKSLGSGTYAVAWQQFYPQTTGCYIYAAELDRGGALRAMPFHVEHWASDNSPPRVSTVADIPGEPVYLVVWTRHDPVRNLGQLRAAVRHATSTHLVGYYDLSSLLGVPAATTVSDPAVDSDGVRFSIVHSERPMSASGPGPYELRASTLALDDYRLLVHENRALLATGDPTSSWSAAIASRYGGGLADSRSYGVVAGTTSRVLQGWLYNGHQPGNFWSRRGGGCGPQLGYGGYPVLGHSIILQVPSNDPVRGILLGLPGPLRSLSICPSCTIGVRDYVTMASPYVRDLPYAPALVGITFSAQGFSLGSPGPCLGSVRFTDVIDFTLR